MDFFHYEFLVLVQIILNKNVLQFPNFINIKELAE